MNLAVCMERCCLDSRPDRRKVGGSGNMLTVHKGAEPQFQTQQAPHLASERLLVANQSFESFDAVHPALTGAWAEQNIADEVAQRTAEPLRQRHGKAHFVPPIENDFRQQLPDRLAEHAL